MTASYNYNQNRASTSSTGWRLRKPGLDLVSKAELLERRVLDQIRRKSQNKTSQQNGYKKYKNESALVSSRVSTRTEGGPHTTTGGGDSPR